MKKRNIIFIITDQERYDSLGCCGNPNAVTPNIDSLAEDGCVFDRFISSSSICQPSRCSILTGLHASSHGVWTNGITLPRKEYIPLTKSAKNAFPGKWVASHITTFADIFREQGYSTIAIGKLHFSPYNAHPDVESKECSALFANATLANWHGPYCGFEDIQITTGHGEDIGGHYGVWLKKEHPEVWKAVLKTRKIRKLEFPEHCSIYPSEIPADLHNSSWIGNRACEKIREKSAEENPFVMWVGFPDPHQPYVPPKELADEFKDRETLSPIPVSVGENKPEALKNLMRKRNAENAKPEFFKRTRQYTNAMMNLIDQNIGQIINTLKETGEWENTVIVFTSDHGDFLGDYGMDGKCLPCCKSLNHVPFILRIPGSDLSARSSASVSGVDILPTLCEAANLATPDFIHGESVLSVMKSGRKHPVIIQHFTPTPDRRNLSIYDDRFRLTWYPGSDEYELYDHQNDPFELDNLAVFPRYKAKLNELASKLYKEQTRIMLPRAGRITVW